jgi:neutral ceramidase
MSRMSDAGLRAGYARRDITPPLGSTLGGRPMFRPRSASRVRDPLSARALYLQCGHGEATLLAADLVLVTARLQAAVADAAGIPPERLFLTATHTHSGPGGYFRGSHIALFMGRYREADFAALVTELAATALEAKRSAARAELSFARTELPGASVSRRRADGPVDPTLSLIRIDREGALPVAVVAFGAHAVAGMMNEPRTATADYPGALCRLIEARGCHAIFLQGAVAGTNPVPLRHAPSALDACITGMAASLDRGVQLLDERRERVSCPGIVVSTVPFGVEPSCRLFPEGMRFRSALAVLTAPVRRLLQALARAGQGDNPSMQLSLLELGHLAILGMPFEAGPSIVRELRSALVSAGVRYPVLVSLCNGHAGYVHLSDEYRHIPARGYSGLTYYENAMSLGGWDAGDMVLAAARAALKDRGPARGRARAEP